MAIAGVPRRPNRGADPLHFWRTPEGGRVTLIQTGDGWTNMDGTPVNPGDLGLIYEISASDLSDQTIAEMQANASRANAEANRLAQGQSSRQMMLTVDGEARPVTVNYQGDQRTKVVFDDDASEATPEQIRQGNIRPIGDEETSASQLLSERLDLMLRDAVAQYGGVSTDDLSLSELQRSLEAGSSIAGYTQGLNATLQQRAGGNGTIQDYIAGFSPQQQAILIDANEEVRALGRGIPLELDDLITHDAALRLSQYASGSAYSSQNRLVTGPDIDVGTFPPAARARISSRRWNANNPPEMAEFIQAAEASPEGTQLFDVISSIRLLLGEAPEVVRAAMASQVSPGDTVSAERLRSVDPENLSLPELHMILSSGQEFPNWATFAAAIQGL